MIDKNGAIRFAITVEIGSHGGVPTEPGIVPGWRARTRGRLTDLLGKE